MNKEKLRIPVWLFIPVALLLTSPPAQAQPLSPLVQLTGDELQCTRIAGLGSFCSNGRIYDRSISVFHNTRVTAVTTLSEFSLNTPIAAPSSSTVRDGSLLKWQVRRIKELVDNIPPVADNRCEIQVLSFSEAEYRLIWYNENGLRFEYTLQGTDSFDSPLCPPEVRTLVDLLVRWGDTIRTR